MLCACKCLELLRDDALGIALAFVDSSVSEFDHPELFLCGLDHVASLFALVKDFVTVTGHESIRVICTDAHTDAPHVSVVVFETDLGVAPPRMVLDAELARLAISDILPKASLLINDSASTA